MTVNVTKQKSNDPISIAQVALRHMSDEMEF